MKNLGPYKLEAVLGRGGMGTVYRAVNTETDEIEAVKVLAPAFSNDEHFRNRFESEIKALIKLDHPNIVRLISYGQYDSNLYFAMELVEGQSLFQLQRSGPPFHWREVIRIAKNVALGLRHAHDRGVIHRDLKPGNLLRAKTGIVKITDFGIAKSYGHSSNTGTNVLGTIDFMSPEQAKGQPVTMRSDLYSLGTVMFALLAGRPPFSGNSVEESMRNLTKVPAPKVSRMSPDVPEPLEELVSQLLEKDPENRIQTALSLYHQLKQIQQKLKSKSQAKTADFGPKAPAEKTIVGMEPSTNVDAFRGSAHTVNIPGESGVAATGRPKTSESRTGDSDRTSSPDLPKLKKAEDDSDDFFNAVTDDERKKHLVPGNKDRKVAPIVGKLVLAGLLAGVLGLGALGAYAVLKVPAAETLLADIEESWDSPQKRMEEIDLFLANYDGHEKAPEIRLRKSVAFANQKKHKLRLRRRVSKQLSGIETSLLGILEEAEADKPAALEKLKALLTLHGEDTDLDAKDTGCIDVAKKYLEPLQLDATKQIENVRSDIVNQFERAKKLAGPEALVVYKSVIELNSKFVWVSDLIDRASEEVEAIQDP